MKEDNILVKVNEEIEKLLETEGAECLENRYAVRYGIKESQGELHGRQNDREDWKVVSIMPLPENMTVLIPARDDFGREYLTDNAALPWAYCLALCRSEKHNGSEVFPYNLNEGIDMDAIVFPVRMCPDCGKKMRIPFMAYGDIGSAKYHCDCCGYEENPFLDDDLDYDKVMVYGCPGSTPENE